MAKSSTKKLLGIILALLFLLLNYSPYVQDIKRLPTQIHIFLGDTKTLQLQMPLPVKIEAVILMY